MPAAEVVLNVAPAPAPAASATRRAADAHALERAAQRIAAQPQPPWLHTEVARRMAERLPIMKAQPRAVLDWWARAGGGTALLHAAYPRADITAVEAFAGAAGPPSAGTRRWWPALPWQARAPAVMASSAAPAGGAQLVWANMMLHALVDPMPTLRQWQRALAVDGFLMFSTLGPGSLIELTALYRTQRWGAPMAALTDMHDLGDMLVQAGFADPVMDQETVTLHWADPAAALAELRGLGANAAPARHAGLRTPRWRSALHAALARVSAPDTAVAVGTQADTTAAAPGRTGRVSFTFEIVYGHAFKPHPRAALAAESHVALEDLRAMARAGRRTR